MTRDDDSHGTASSVADIEPDAYADKRKRVTSEDAKMHGSPDEDTGPGKLEQGPRPPVNSTTRVPATPARGRYRAFQDNDSTSDPDAPPPNGNNRVRPILTGPVETYHPVFASFLAESRDETLEVPTAIVQQTGEFVRDQQSPFLPLTRTSLEYLLDCTLQQPATRDGSFAGDVALFVRHTEPSGTAVLAVVQYAEAGLEDDAPETDGTEFDLSVKASYSYLEHWRSLAGSEIRNACFCPSFLFALDGYSLVVCGAILTTDVIVHRLTARIWLGTDTDQESVTRVARVLYALRRALNRLCGFYEQLGPSPQGQKGARDERFFSLATSYLDHETGTTVSFTYVKYLAAQDSSCRTFLATLNSDGRTKVVVKFVDRYGAEAHTLLAEKGLAPKLLYCGSIWQSGPEREGCGQRRMVVMEYVEGQDAEARWSCRDGNNRGPIPEKTCSAVREAIGILHERGLVHGDVRRPNIIVPASEDGDGCHQVKIIGFEAAGRAGEARYPVALSRDVRWPDGVEDRGLIAKEHDLKMVEWL